MLFVFGWGHETIKNHGSAQVYNCLHCNNARPWHLLSKKTWATIFFLPIVPYKFEYMLMCPVCRCGTMLNHGEFEAYKEKINGQAKT
ncbi:MAG: hypothetical protein BGN88_07520 [Clostridiales bacterium 43-6]|nr:MAG: hypothetical protein BGN88_07520 [Clostridiales bacterium 43-6]